METNTTARNFAIQLGSLIALYVSLTALLMVIFGVTNIILPDDSTGGYYSYIDAQQGIRFGIALLIIFFPTYIVLTRSVNTIRRKEASTYLAFTKWLVYLSLLVGGGILLGDLVTVILTYLNGEITLRFIIKALALCAAIGTAFYYYILDARGYWNLHEQRSIYFAGTATTVVIAALVLGFLHSDTPSKARDIKIDEQEIADLSDMQYRIEDHYRVNTVLPKDITSLYVGINPPLAPANRTPYEYASTGTTTYQLCATFAYPTQNSRTPEISVKTEPINSESNVTNNPYNNWDHGAGKTCFARTVTPPKQTN